MSPQETITFLRSLPRFDQEGALALKPGLERIKQLLKALGNPQNQFQSIHVAGTNGKGSTASMIAAIGTAAGEPIGLHTTPHLQQINELMRINGTPVSSEWLADAVNQLREDINHVEPSFFEATVALSFLYFALQEVNWAVVEVGLGGRLDATNVLHPTLSVITSIDLEHTSLLGETLGEIAREKAGIIKPETPVLSGVTQDAAQTTIREVANTQDAPLHALDDETSWSVSESDLSGAVLDMETPIRRYRDLYVALSGHHQQRNAALAIRAAELMFPAVQESPGPVREGLREVRRLAGLRGRFEVVQTHPWIVADVAHNPSSIQATLDTLASHMAGRGGQLYVAFNFFRDKDLATTLDLLVRHNTIAMPVPIDVDRSTPPDQLVQAARETGLRTADPRSLNDALSVFHCQAAPEDLLLVTGSHKLVATLLSLTRESAGSL